MPSSRLRLVIATGAALILLGATVNAQDPPNRSGQRALPSLEDGAQLDDYLAFAALANPGLEAAFNAWQSALQRIDRADKLPDPTVDYAYFIENVETRVGPQRQKLGVTQAIPWLGKLRLRSAIASETANAAEQRYQAVKLRLFFDVKDAYYELYYLSRAIAITKDNIELLVNLEGVAQANFTVGAPLSGVIKAQLELGTLDDQLRTLEALRPAIVARLNATLNRPRDTRVPWPAAPPDVQAELDDEAIHRALKKSNPDLARLRFETARDARALELEQKALRPDFKAGFDWVDTGRALANGVPGSGSDPLVARFGVSVPVWRKKLRAGIRAAELRRAATAAQTSELENGLTARLELVLFRFHDAERKIDLFRDTLVPLADASLGVAQEGYEAGKEDFLNVIDAQRLLLELQLAYERSIADRAQRLAEVEMLVGSALTTPSAQKDPEP